MYIFFDIQILLLDMYFIVRQMLKDVYCNLNYINSNKNSEIEDNKKMLKKLYKGNG